MLIRAIALSVSLAILLLPLAGSGCRLSLRRSGRHVLSGPPLRESAGRRPGQRERVGQSAVSERRRGVGGSEPAHDSEPVHAPTIRLSRLLEPVCSYAGSLLPSQPCGLLGFTIHTLERAACA
jgi:hypothetical protein